MKLVLNTLFNSYRQTWFSVSMLFIAVLTGASGLGMVLNLSDRAEQIQAPDAWYNFDRFHSIVPLGDSPLLLADYATLKRQLPMPLIALKQIELPLDNASNVSVLGIDSLAAIEARPFLQNTQATLETILRNAVFFSRHVYLNSNTDEQLRQVQTSTQSVPLRHLLKNTEIQILDELEDRLIIADIGHVLAAQEPHLSKQLSTIIIPFELSEEDKTILYQTLPSTLRLQAPIDRFSSTRMSESFQLNLLALGLLMFAVCMFIVLNAGNLLIYKRMSMLLVLRQLGFSRQKIIASHFVEFTVVSLIAASVATLLAQLVDQLSANSLSGIIGKTQANRDFLSRYLQLAFISWIGVLLALIHPLLRLKAQLLNETQNKPRSNHQHWLVMSILFASFCLSALLYVDNLSLLLGLTASFVLACAVILMCLLPIVIAKLSQLLPPTYFIISGLSIKSALSLSQRTALAFCAFFIAVTCNIGMNLMVDSFRQATDDWLQQRLIADAYLYKDKGLEQSSLAWMTARGIEVLPRYEEKQSYQQMPIDIYSYPDTPDYKAALRFEKHSNSAWHDFQHQKGVFINQQFANHHKLELGEVITLVHPKTQTPKDYVISGIYLDYGNPYGQSMMPVDAFADSPSRVYALSFSTPVTKEALQQLADDTASQVFSSKDLLALSMKSFEDTFVITRVLNLVTLLVAGIALACTILVLLDETRAKQFLLKSIGFSRYQIRQINLLQYLALVLIGLLLATPFGILIAWILINVINFAAFDWRYPLVVDLIVFVKVYAMSLCVLATTIAIPSYMQKNKEIAKELAWLE